MGQNQEEFMAAPTFETLLYAVEDGVATVTLNRPEVMNALHSPAHFELGEVFDAFAADPEQWEIGRAHV